MARGIGLLRENSASPRRNHCTDHNVVARGFRALCCQYPRRTEHSTPATLDGAGTARRPCERGLKEKAKYSTLLSTPANVEFWGTANGNVVNLNVEAKTAS